MLIFYNRYLPVYPRLAPISKNTVASGRTDWAILQGLHMYLDLIIHKINYSCYYVLLSQISGFTKSILSY